MFLIVGLGNPEYEYEYTRHNFGFLVIDALKERLIIRKPAKDSISVWNETKINRTNLIIAKPLTFMNESGRAVKLLLKKFKLMADNLIVVHDDLDLELGKIRIKKGSSGGGHLGVDSVIENIGTSNFIRIRLGIGRPPGRKNPAVFVLEQFKKGEKETVEFAIHKGADAILDLVKMGLEEAMNKYN